jgi:hypothetical protein
MQSVLLCLVLIGPRELPVGRDAYQSPLSRL